LKIRKYEGCNELEAMLKVKEELGKEALIVSVKNVKPKGIYKIFKKPYVEVTAALDDKAIEKSNSQIMQIDRKLIATSEKKEKNNNDYIEKFHQLIDNITNNSVSNDEKNNMVDGYNNIQDNINNRDNINIGEDFINNVKDVDSNNDEIDSIIKVIYEQLLESEINEEVANYLTNGLAEMSISDKINVDDIVSVIYKRIIKMLSDNEPIILNKNHAKTVMFIGPTGVGKTTTIAKIASYFTLNLNKNVALITADTYRIAAVEQLRTYANILNIPIKIVYTHEELDEAIKLFKDKDLILVDTAGRSYKNAEHQQEIVELVNSINNKDVFLVLSLTTKYSDILNITKSYEDIFDYKIVLTKLDETSSYGNVLNLKKQTGAKLSYVTFGQNVPDDISEINPHEVAKNILGGNE
jgi:flagellar biosynthesis protein FlhF